MIEKSNKEGKVVVVSGPSGVGKSTICREVVKRLHDVCLSVSVTTRPKGQEEVEGKDYRFISRREFKKRIERGLLLEHAEVFGHWYGTPKDEVDKALRGRKAVILEIDVQGGRQAKMRYPEAIMVFVLPPSAKVLAERMNHRGRDDNETIEQRLQEAGREIAAGWQYYEHMVINGDLPQAVKEVCEIIERARNEPASDETADTR